MRILVIDDDRELRALLVKALERDGHVAVAAGSAAEARAAMAVGDAEVVVLDVGLPDGSGLSLCRELRTGGSDVPILLLTAHSGVGQRVEGLDAGADDFLGKPFALAELRARVRALGRRRAHRTIPRIELGELVIDLGERRAARAGRDVALTAREWAILEALAARDARVVPRAELVKEIWGEATDATQASCEVLVGRIRKKLGDAVVRTLRGEGYALGEGFSAHLDVKPNAR